VLSPLRQPRWWAMTVLVIVLVLACWRLAHWQLDRLHGRERANDSISAAERKPPVDAGTLLTVGRSVSGAAWRSVRLTGHWDGDHQLLVRNRAYQDTNGFLVLTPLVGSDGRALLVVRGWVPFGRTATSNPDVPAPQAGQVTVVARVRASEPPRSLRLPAGQIARIDVPALAGDLPYPVYGDYAELVQEQPVPASAPQVLPAPTLGNGPHLSYALQWFSFMLVAIVGWFILLRRDSGEQEAFRREEGAAGDVDRPQDSSVSRS
jgi:cytochrome oxidase assembly protein ShyY1